MGRSNVGKSSLLNKVFGRKGFARVSKTPGRTREIHFYLIDERYYLVDLPGFGYAKVPEAMRRRWAALMESYLERADTLALALQLVDARHEPTRLDRTLTEALAGRTLRFAVALTKGDKLSGSEAPRSLSRARKGLGLAKDVPVVLTSATTGLGVDDVKRLIQDAVRDARGTNQPSS
jgi:GTP-binding protein